MQKGAHLLKTSASNIKGRGTTSGNNTLLLGGGGGGGHILEQLLWLSRLSQLAHLIETREYVYLTVFVCCSMKYNKYNNWLYDIVTSILKMTFLSLPIDMFWWKIFWVIMINKNAIFVQKFKTVNYYNTLWPEWV